jgi:hypothetical protein
MNITEHFLNEKIFKFPETAILHFSLAAATLTKLLA